MRYLEPLSKKAHFIAPRRDATQKYGALHASAISDFHVDPDAECDDEKEQQEEKEDEEEEEVMEDVEE